VRIAKCGGCGCSMARVIEGEGGTVCALRVAVGEIQSPRFGRVDLCWG
jgi:hypothetical protein